MYSLRRKARRRVEVAALLSPWTWKAERDGSEAKLAA
jgi:hypothetical protein